LYKDIKRSLIGKSIVLICTAVIGVSQVAGTSSAAAEVASAVSQAASSSFEAGRVVASAAGGGLAAERITASEVASCWAAIASWVAA